MRRRKIDGVKLKNPVKFFCTIVAVIFTVTQIISMIQLTNISRITISSPKSKISYPNVSRGAKIGEFGETVMKMLPGDLAFTLFLPSEEAIRRELKLDRNDSSNAYAILTRVLGFSAVPRWISSAELGIGEERIYDSVSGFSLYVGKDSNGMVVVNGIVSEEVDLKIGNIIVHVMNGVVMDAEFQQSLGEEEDEEDDGDGLG